MRHEQMKLVRGTQSLSIYTQKIGNDSPTTHSPIPQHVARFLDPHFNNSSRQPFTSRLDILLLAFHNDFDNTVLPFISRLRSYPLLLLVVIYHIHCTTATSTLCVFTVQLLRSLVPRREIPRQRSPPTRPPRVFRPLSSCRAGRFP